MVYEAGFTSTSMRVTLGQQMKWLVQLRWIAVLCIIFAGSVGANVFPILESASPLYGCAAILFLFNGIYFIITSKRFGKSEKKDIVLAMVQLEVDLIVLTILLHWSGGIQNPFLLFYIFHVIIAAIILPRDLSFAVGLSTIFLFGAMAIGEMKGWFGLHHSSWQLGTVASLWRNPVYVLWSYIAFTVTVLLAQFLTRNIITHMRSKELEAARNHDVLMAVINSMSEGLVFQDEQGRLTLCNQAAGRWNGGKDCSQGCVSPDDFPEPLASFLKDVPSVMAEGGDGSRTISFGDIDLGEAYIEAKGRSVINDQQERIGYVVVGEDLTAHQQLERDLRERSKEVTRMNDVLRRSQIEMANREKMVAIGQMASGIAHEIGNPLNSLSAVIQYMGRKLKDSEMVKQLEMVTKQIQRISHILKHMLNVARPGGNESTWTDVNGLVDETLTLVQYDKRSRNVTVVTRMDEEIPTVWTNRQNLEQVLLNVFLNSLDAMTMREDFEDHQLNVDTNLDGEKIRIQISDTGVGMDPESIDHAFDPFYSTKETGKGTGLGLYISRNLLEEIKGTIELTNHDGGGMCVLIEIPAQIVQEAARVNPGQIEMEPTGEN